jgi:stalled ribosome rescue protein Dom34
MLDYVVWLDSEHAQIFALKVTGIEKSRLNKGGPDHHTHNKKDHDSDSNAEHFYRDLALRLKDAAKLLLLGPGLAKNHFKTHLETHHAGGLAKNIIGLKNSDHPTDNQILAEAREFYKTYDLFNSPIQQS